MARAAAAALGPHWRADYSVDDIYNALAEASNDIVPTAFSYNLSEDYLVWSRLPKPDNREMFLLDPWS
jgi:hypothetical protein